MWGIKSHSCKSQEKMIAKVGETLQVERESITYLEAVTPEQTRGMKS